MASRLEAAKARLATRRKNRLQQVALLNDLERALAVVEAALDRDKWSCIGCGAYREPKEGLPDWNHHEDCPLAWWESEEQTNE